MKAGRKENSGHTESLVQEGWWTCRAHPGCSGCPLRNGYLAWDTQSRYPLTHTCVCSGTQLTIEEHVPHLHFLLPPSPAPILCLNFFSPGFHGARACDKWSHGVLKKCPLDACTWPFATLNDVIILRQCPPLKALSLRVPAIWDFFLTIT